jgi:hypothetical protein
MHSSISSIAEGILLQDEAEFKSTGKVTSQHTPTGDLDISNVVVPDNFVDAFIKGKPLPTPINEEVVDVIIEEPKESETKNVAELITEFGQIVARAKTIISEMSTVGALGFPGAMVSSKPKAKKKKVKKKKSSKDDKRKQMFARIKGKLNV